MSCSLNSLTGVYVGDHIWEYYGDYWGDTRSLDDSSHSIAGWLLYIYIYT